MSIYMFTDTGTIFLWSGDRIYCSRDTINKALKENIIFYIGEE